MNSAPLQTRIWIWPIVGALALAGGVAARYLRQTPVESAVIGPKLSTSVVADSPAPDRQLTADIRKQLQTAGWSDDAAAEVTDLNAEFFSLLKQEDPVQLDRITRSLARLGARPSVMRLLVRRPEVAGLLASAADPGGIAASLRKDRYYNAVSNIYGRHGADAVYAADALERHGSLICHLIGEGMLGAETVFIFPRGSAGAEAYDQWLSAAFQSAMTDEDRLASMFQLVMVQGAALRREMIDDAKFRFEFPNVAWVRLERLVDAGDFPLELAALDVNLFRLLALPQGEQLVRRWGLLPLELLYSEGAYPPELHDQLIETMFAGDNATLASLLEFGKEPLLAPLLARDDVSPQVKAAALSKLHAAGSDYPALLRRYSEMGSAAALADEVGPPPSGPVTWLPLYYTVYEVPKKILQGRNPTMMDAAIAVLDPVFLFLGPLGPDDAVKVVGQESVKAAGRRTAAKTAATTLRSAAHQQATRQLGAQAVRIGARETAPWLITQMLRGSRTAVKRKVQSSMTVDVTGPTRLLFRLTGVGGNSLRQLTSLEARILMRPDYRILVRLDRLIIAHPAGRFLADTAVAGIVETGIEVPAIENAAVGAARAADKFPDNANAMKGKFTAWQKNISAWWLAQASGLWEQLALEVDRANPKRNGTQGNVEAKP